MTRCRAYRRTRGVFILSRVRCALAAGHAGQHETPGRWLDPAAVHRWGRVTLPTEADMQAGMPGQVRGLLPPKG